MWRGRMGSTVLLASLMLLLAMATPRAAELRQPQPILPEALSWSGPPGIPGLQAAWMLGAEDRPDAYLLRVRLAADTRIPPHSHPDERQTTVLAGTLYVGFGAQFDAGRLVAVPAGAVYVAPAGVPHFLWARDGEVLYQEAGIGPTATRLQNR